MPIKRTPALMLISAEQHKLLELIGFPLILIGTLEILLSFILVKQNPRNSPVNKSVAAFSFFTAAYSLITGLMYVRASYGLDVTVLARTNWFSWMMIPAGLQFVFYMRDERSQAARKAGLILYPFWFIVFCVSLFTDLIERGNYSLIPFIDHSGPLAKPLRLIGLVLIGWVMYEVYRLRRRVTGIKKAQLNYFAHGVLIFCGGGALLAGVLQLFGGFGLEPGLGSYFSLPWVVLTFYAITRHRLFDIRIIISRTVTILLLGSIFSGIQIGFFVLLEPLIGSSLTIVVSLFFIGFVFFGTPFSSNIRRWVQQLVYQKKFDYQQVLKDSSKAVLTILDFHEMLDYLMNSIRTSLGVENACLFLKGTDGVYTRQVSLGMMEVRCSEGNLDGMIVEWVKKSGQTVILEELEEKQAGEEFDFVGAFMKKTGAELLMPLIFKGRLQGVLTLGRKGDQEAYTESDLELLEVLAGQAAVAIENALLYERARQVQVSLRESQERFKNLIETTSDWVWEMNDRGVYTYVSPRIRDILGYEPEEVVGKTFFDFMPREEARRAADFFVSLTRNNRPFLMFQNTNLHKTGRLVILETSGIPFFDQAGRFAGYRGIDRDVTQRNELEGQLRYAQKMEAIGRLAAGVAHDFNNINTAIVGYANLLYLRMAKDDPLRENVDRILAATERSSNLTKSLLTFSKKQTVQLLPFKLNEIIGRMERIIAGLLRDDIELRLDQCKDDLMVAADQVQIERIIMNLAANARDAMPGGGRFTIGTRQADIDESFIAARGYGKPGTYALISVSDTGTGMEERVMQKIFEPFFTTKGAGRGTGFGLSIVYDIVKQHRGYVTVESSPGKGASFHLYLPLIRTSIAATRPAAPAVTAARTGTVLVADNDADDRHLIKVALEGLGYRVIEAVDGEDAVEKFRQHNDRLHSLILDIVMPKMNGKDTYQAIRRKQPDVKVLFTSSYTEDVILEQGMVDDNMNFILKPFSSKELLDRVTAMG